MIELIHNKKLWEVPDLLFWQLRSRMEIKIVEMEKKVNSEILKYKPQRYISQRDVLSFCIYQLYKYMEIRSKS